MKSNEIFPSNLSLYIAIYTLRRKNWTKSSGKLQYELYRASKHFKCHKKRKFKFWKPILNFLNKFIHKNGPEGHKTAKFSRTPFESPFCTYRQSNPVVPTKRGQNTPKRIRNATQNTKKITDNSTKENQKIRK